MNKAKWNSVMPDYEARRGDSTPCVLLTIPDPAKDPKGENITECYLNIVPKHNLYYTPEYNTSIGYGGRVCYWTTVKEFFEDFNTVPLATLPGSLAEEYLKMTNIVKIAKEESAKASGVIEDAIIRLKSTSTILDTIQYETGRPIK